MKGHFDFFEDVIFIALIYRIYDIAWKNLFCTSSLKNRHNSQTNVEWKSSFIASKFVAISPNLIIFSNVINYKIKYLSQKVCVTLYIHAAGSLHF